MDKDFDVHAAKKFLEIREHAEREKQEEIRKSTLALCIEILKKMFFSANVEVYLVGSILKPYMFHTGSDVDIVLKNFTGDRFDVWTQLEAMIQRKVEVIIFETCHFQDYVMQNGYKVL